jgi:hypothetical protein
VFFDITIGGLEAGRMKMELFKDVAPRTAENFRRASALTWHAPQRLRSRARTLNACKRGARRADAPAPLPHARAHVRAGSCALASSSAHPAAPCALSTLTHTPQTDVFLAPRVFFAGAASSRPATKAAPSTASSRTSVRPPPRARVPAIPSASPR